MTPVMTSKYTAHSNEFYSVDVTLDWTTSSLVTRFSVSNSIDDVSNSTPIFNSTRSSYSAVEMTFLGLVAGLTSLITISGNLVVILSFVLERSIRQPTNYFIASLAVSDLLIGSVSMPLYTVYLLAGQHWPLGEKICDLWLSIDYTVCLCSIYTVFCITVDRFCSVTVPAKYRNWRTERKVLAIICVTWTFPVGVFFTSIFGWQYFVGVRTVEPGKCYVQYMENAIFNAVLQLGYFWITLIVMCCLYTGIYRVALRLQRKSDQKHRKTTTLVSVAGEAMTKIGIGLSKHQQEELKRENKATTFNHLRPTQNHSMKEKKKEHEEHSNSPDFSSDSDHNPCKFNRQIEAMFSKTKNSETTSVRDAIQRPSNSNRKETKDVSSGVVKETADSDLFGFLATTSIHSNLFNLREKTLSMGAPTDGFLAIDETKEETSAEARQSLEANSNQSADNVWLLRTTSSAQLNDATDAARESSVTSSPVWIRRSLEQLSRLDSRAENSNAPSFQCINGNKAENNTLRQESLNNRSRASSRRKRPAPGKDTTADPPTDGGKESGRSGKRRERRKRGAGGCSGSDRRRRRYADASAAGGWFESFRSRIISRSGSTASADGSPGNSRTSRSEDRAMKALRAITIILGAFVLCWTPWHVLSMIIGFCAECVNPFLYDVSYWLCYLNSPINPFCYAFANLQFKSTFVRIFRLDWHRT